MADPPEDPSGFVDITGVDYFGPEQRFPLLDLPRELRDAVYERMLVRKAINIVPGYCWEKRTRSNPQRFDLRVPVHQRSTYERTLAAGMQYASYEERKGGSRRNHNCPNLNIFLTCRQVYDESSSVYYKQNLFSFHFAGCTKEVLSVQACHAFLLDRPLQSLQRLRFIKLTINTSTLSSPAADWLDGDVVVPLVNFMRDNLCLDCFSLDVDGWTPDMRSAPWDWSVPEPDCNEDPRKWVGAFARLTNLKSLEITLAASDDGDCGRLVACAAFLRSSMLINGAALGTKNIHAYHRHVDFSYWQMDDKPCDLHFRGRGRFFVVQCYDNEHGKSLLPQKSHPSPSFPGIKAKRVQQGHNPAAVERALRDAIAEKPYEDLTTYRIFCDEDQDDCGESDGDSVWNRLDYDLSDDGDNDSLISIDLSGLEVDYVRDDEYFEYFDEHEHEHKPCTTG
ncbi:hypothetical protein DIS24_g4728 [Lasiodiplodia hormozganensis]|uniref:DUF7730 domain-containing protein n=1 Tax=Lasiodiplodia hormozganensis TaxID=869390 RepID=A0AA40D1M5_9PEZI|nr:hypothetical protein DIS24_g4728 [Lasiodiplodia hormozganensis]